jgi:ADP-ribosylation factor GTPase-activating protein 1
MDAWNPDQLRKMQAGGNGKLNEFFARYGIDKATEIKAKYNNRVAEVGAGATAGRCRAEQRRAAGSPAAARGVARPLCSAAEAVKRRAATKLWDPNPNPPLQTYRDKIRAEVEGRPFTAPPVGSIKVDLAQPAGNGGMARPVTGAGPGGRAAGGDDGWGDWGGSGGAGAGAGGSGAANGQYSMSALQASAANKEQFFERRMMENASRPDGLPPSQGGKYVGFGSAPAPRPGGRRAGADGDDVGALLSKGLQTLTVVAGSAAGTATEALRHGKDHVSTLLAEKHVTETAKHLQEKGSAIASAGWMGLQKLYANVASTVETAAKESGYKIDLGSRQVAAHVQQTSMRSGSSGSGSGGRYGGFGSNDYAGAGGYGSEPHMQHSVSDGRLGGQQQQHGSQSWQQQQQHGGGGSGGSFSGFDNGSNNNGWDEWGSSGAHAGGERPAAPAAAPVRSGITPQKSISSPDMRGKPKDDDWGAW